MWHSRASVLPSWAIFIHPYLEICCFHTGGESIRDWFPTERCLSAFAAFHFLPAITALQIFFHGTDGASHPDLNPVELLSTAKRDVWA